jgi:hypothetical protein
MHGDTFRPARLKILVSVLALTMTLACKMLARPIPGLPESPSSTRVSTPTAQPSRTPSPTSTPDLVLLEAQTFMDPILGSVAGLTPDFEDDFDDPNSGWPTGFQPNPGEGHEEGVVGYADGEYFVEASEAKFPWENNAEKKITCQSAFHSPALTVKDFVLEVDARFVSPDNRQGEWQTRFWDRNDYFWTAYLNPDGNAVLNTNYPLTLDAGDRAGTSPATIFNPGNASNHMVMVVKDNTAAIRLNGAIVVYIDRLPEQNPGPVAFTVCNFGLTPFRAQWDNIKIWKLD